VGYKLKKLIVDELQRKLLISVSVRCFSNELLFVVEWADKRHQKDSNIHIMPSLNLSTTVSLSAEPNFSRLPKYVSTLLMCLNFVL